MSKTLPLHNPENNGVICVKELVKEFSVSLRIFSISILRHCNLPKAILSTNKSYPRDMLLPNNSC